MVTIEMGYLRLVIVFLAQIVENKSCLGDCGDGSDIVESDLLGNCSNENEKKILNNNQFDHGTFSELVFVLLLSGTFSELVFVLLLSLLGPLYPDVHTIMLLLQEAPDYYLSVSEYFVTL